GLSQRRAAIARPGCDQRGLSAAEELPRPAMAAEPEGPRGSALAPGHFARQRRLQQRADERIERYAKAGREGVKIGRAQTRPAQSLSERCSGGALMLTGGIKSRRGRTACFSS